MFGVSKVTYLKSSEESSVSALRESGRSFMKRRNRSGHTMAAIGLLAKGGAVLTFLAAPVSVVLAGLVLLKYVP